jgi:hypothetical protein
MWTMVNNPPLQHSRPQSLGNHHHSQFGILRTSSLACVLSFCPHLLGLLLPSALLGISHCQSSFVIDATREEEGILSKIIISQSTFQGCGKGSRNAGFGEKVNTKKKSSETNKQLLAPRKKNEALNSNARDKLSTLHFPAEQDKNIKKNGVTVAYAISLVKCGDK